MALGTFSGFPSPLNLQCAMGTLPLLLRPEGPGTRLTLTHTGWERHGAEARKARRGYPIGWTYVLAIYAGKKGPLVYALDGVGMIVRVVQR